MIQINKLAMFSLMSDCNMRIWILYGLYFYGNYLYCILLFKIYITMFGRILTNNT
jgi:hypothetical protein